MSEQLDAIRRGLSVFIDDALFKQINSFFSPCELQLLLCGTPEIDVDEWQAETMYGSLLQTSSQHASRLKSGVQCGCARMHAYALRA